MCYNIKNTYYIKAFNKQGGHMIKRLFERNKKSFWDYAYSLHADSIRYTETPISYTATSIRYTAE